MTDLADWMELQRPKATHDFALGRARFQEMLKATEGVTISLAVLEKAGHDDLQRNLAALKAACAPKTSVQLCVDKVESQKPALGFCG